MPSFFIPLHAWARRQDENFTSELLTAILRTVVGRDRHVGSQLLNWIGGQQVTWTPPDLEAVTVRTQYHGPASIPDIRISTPTKCVDIECKITQPADRDQLLRHLRGLGEVEVPEKALVLLTRYTVDAASIPAGVVWRRWQDLAKSFASEQCADAVSGWLIAELVRFLGERGMALDHVDSSLVSGLASAQGLVVMAEEVLRDLGVVPRSSRSGKEWGWWCEGGDVYEPLGMVGVWVQLDRPGFIRVNAQAVDEIRWNGSTQRGYLGGACTGGHDWSEDIDLLQDGFFDLDVQTQQGYLRAKLESAYRYAAGVAALSVLRPLTPTVD